MQKTTGHYRSSSLKYKPVCPVLQGVGCYQSYSWESAGVELPLLYKKRAGLMPIRFFSLVSFVDGGQTNLIRINYNDNHLPGINEILKRIFIALVVQRYFGRKPGSNTLYRDKHHAP